MLKELGTVEAGLAEKEANLRLERYEMFGAKKKQTLAQKIWAQIKTPWFNPHCCRRCTFWAKLPILSSF